MRTQYPTRSNLDITGTRRVCKGCLVRFPGGAVAKVAAVRLGWFVPDVLPKGARHFTKSAACNDVEVIVEKG